MFAREDDDLKMKRRLMDVQSGDQYRTLSFGRDSTVKGSSGALEGNAPD